MFLTTALRCVVKSGRRLGRVLHQYPMKSTSPNLYAYAGILNIARRGVSTDPEDKTDPRTIPDSEWIKRLTPEQYAVCRERNTEPPYTGKYVNHFQRGMYHCICCDTVLFSSETKYESSSGWPSFYEAYGTENGDMKPSNILQRSDNSLGMVRTEVLCKKCDAHLGHVFDDGPKPTGKRFCINSMALKFRSFRPKN